MENRIKDLRRKFYMSQKDLAKKLNTTQSTVSQWENGHYQPDYSAQVYLAYMFRCSVDYLMGMTSTPASERMGWSDELEANYAEYLRKNYTNFVDHRTEEDIMEQERLESQAEERNDEERAFAIQEYVNDCWEKAGRPGTVEGFAINMMTENLSYEDRLKLLNVVRAVFPEAALL